MPAFIFPKCVKDALLSPCEGYIILCDILSDDGNTAAQQA
jgi:hypothetical protein